MTPMELATKFCDNSACHDSMPCAKCKTQASKIEAEMSALNLQNRELMIVLRALHDEVSDPPRLHEAQKLAKELLDRLGKQKDVRVLCSSCGERATADHNCGGR